MHASYELRRFAIDLLSLAHHKLCLTQAVFTVQAVDPGNSAVRITHNTAARQKAHEQEAELIRVARRRAWELSFSAAQEILQRRAELAREELEGEKGTAGVWVRRAVRDDNEKNEEDLCEEEMEGEEEDAILKKLFGQVKRVREPHQNDMGPL